MPVGQFDRDVVQEAGCAESGGDQQAGRPGGGSILQPRPPQLQIVGDDRRHLVEDCAGRVEHRGRAATGGIHSGQQSRGQRAGLLALLGVQVAVTRRHRQPVGLPHGGHADNARIEIEVVGHLADQHELLVVLLAEEGLIRAHDLQQLQHHREHAGEMCWADGTFEFATEWTRVNGGARTVGIHHGRSGGEHHFDALIGKQLHVSVEGARVGIEVLTGAELQRVDEDRHHDHRSGHPLGGAHQGQVPVVQRTHGGNQHHPAAGVT